MTDNREEIRFRNPAKQVGFAQLYHVATLDPELSDGALRTFLLYLKYAQQKDICFPGRERLAQERNVGVATLSRHNTELVKAGYITRKRRLNRPSLTIIEDYENIPRLRAIAEQEIAERIKNEMSACRKNDTNGGLKSDTNECIKNEPSNVAKMQRRMSHFCDVEEEQVEEEEVEEEDLPAPDGAENSALPDPDSFETDSTLTGDGDDGSPASGQERLAALRRKFGRDPLSVAATCAGAQERAGPLAGYTVPASAGGADPFAGAPLEAFCRLVKTRPDLLTESKQRSWSRKLRELAEAHGLDAAEMARCIALLPESDWAWRVASFTSPYAGGFDEVISALILRVLADQPIATPTGSGGGGKDGKAGRARPRAARREYEPCSDGERAAVWALHGSWMQHFMAEKRSDLQVDHLDAMSYQAQVAAQLGLSERQAQALCEAHNVNLATEAVPLDPAMFFDE